MSSAFFPPCTIVLVRLNYIYDIETAMLRHGIVLSLLLNMFEGYDILSVGLKSATSCLLKANK
jgi:hypothetical protein